MRRSCLPPKAVGLDFENTTGVNPSVFPEPRLQTDDAVDMNRLLQSERKILYAEQPFKDQSGTIHLPITEAMKVIEERGLPVRPTESAAGAVAQGAAPATKAVAAQATPGGQ